MSARTQPTSGSTASRFKEASELFTSGADYLEIFDELHSETEDRFINIGAVQRGVVLVVTTEPQEDVLRIVSARAATVHEAAMLVRHLKGKNNGR